MGLRFRKSINLGSGFKVNLSGSGVGFSWGVPGFRVSKGADGKVRQTVSLPGTGLSYQTTLGGKKKSSSKSSSTKSTAKKAVGTLAAAGAAAAVGAAVKGAKKSTKSAEKPSAKSTAKSAPAVAEAEQTQGLVLTREILKSIYSTSDEPVDWAEISSSPTPTDDLYDADFWSYCHEAAQPVLQGNIDAYLQVIQDMNPYDDLLDFGENFLFGTDTSEVMEVEFTAKSKALMPSKRSIGSHEYYDLLQDYICSVAVRTARDTFALLPVDYVKIHAVDGGKLVLSVCFDRKTFTKIRFSLADPSDIVEKFPHNMDFNFVRGFAEVDEI